MNIDILRMRKFQPNDQAFYVALPVWAVECEVSPPLSNDLDAYEDAVLKLVSIRLSVRGIAGALNATESLIEEIMDHLLQKAYVGKKSGQPWKLTEDGVKYLNGSVRERAAEDSQFGYMFVNAIKKDVLPFFHSGAINQLPLYTGTPLPLRLTVGKDEDKTFEPVSIKRAKLKDAYWLYINMSDAAKRYEKNEITSEEWVDPFEGLEGFDEEEEEDSDKEEDSEPTLESADKARKRENQKGLFVRDLKRPYKRVWLTMRIIIDPKYPGGYRVESPFELKGFDNDYFLRQIQWLAASESACIGDRKLGDYLNGEIRKLSPSFKNVEKDFSVFVLEKMPLLRINRSRFENVYEDMERIYGLMQRQSSLIEKINIINNISKSVLERLFNLFFKPIGRDTLSSISSAACSDLAVFGINVFVQQMTQNTGLDPTSVQLNKE